MPRIAPRAQGQRSIVHVVQALFKFSFGAMSAGRSVWSRVVLERSDSVRGWGIFHCEWHLRGEWAVRGPPLALIQGLQRFLPRAHAPCSTRVELCGPLVLERFLPGAKAADDAVKMPRASVACPRGTTRNLTIVLTQAFCRIDRGAKVGSLARLDPVDEKRHPVFFGICNQF